MDNGFEIFHSGSLVHSLQHLPITPDKYHLGLSDVVSEIKQWEEKNQSMIKGIFFGLLRTYCKLYIHRGRPCFLPVTGPM